MINPCFLKRLIIYIGFFPFCSCNLFFTDSNEDVILAKAFGEELTYLSIKDQLNGLDSEDSLSTLKSIVNQWVEQQVLLEKAQYNISDETEADISKKVLDYKNSLLIFEYEKELLKSKMDTNISEEEISEYYLEHKHDFILREPIGKFIFLKVKKTSSELKKILTAYKLKNLQDSIYLIDVVPIECEKHFTDKDKWKNIDEIVNETPLKDKLLDKGIFLRQNKYIEIEKEGYVYLINIIDYKLSGDEAPKDFVKESIKLILRNYKKSKIIQKIRSELVKIALSNNNTIIYE